MKPHPRIRKAVMWGGAAATLLLLAAWAASQRWRVVCYSHPWLVGVQPGGVDITRDPLTMYRMPDGWYTSRRVDWSVRIRRPRWEATGSRTHVDIPFWLPAGLTASAGLVAWRRDAAARRLVRAGACASCGYDRSGLAATTPCPECGRPE